MSRYIDAEALPYSEVVVNEYGLVNTHHTVVFAEHIANIPPADVIERAKVLDRIKEVRDEIANYSDFHREHLYKTNPNYDVEQGQYLAYEKCLQIIDNLIAEVEGTK